MLLINTTYQVSESCEKDWKQWVENEYIPGVVQTKLLMRPRFYRLLIENEAGTVSYALQFETENLETLEGWFEKHGNVLQHSMSNRFGEQALGFTTVMEILI